MKNIPEIIYEDDQLVVVNKPPDYLSIPDRHDSTKPNLVSFLQQKFGEIFVVHRIDRETSGILCFARNAEAHRNLCKQFDDRVVEKFYLALADGRMHDDEGIIDKPIAEHSSVAGKMITAARGKASLSLYKVLQRFKHFTLAEIEIKTGRTHQIRVHFQSIGYPLAVDPLYGRRSELKLSEIKGKYKLGKWVDEERPIMSRTTLHAYRLKLQHPVTEEVMNFKVEPPKDFVALVQQLEKWGKLKTDL